MAILPDHPSAMRTPILPAILLLSLTLNAQDALMLVPRWKVGDERSVEVIRNTVLTVNDSTAKERTAWKGKVRVVNETPEALVIRFDVQDPVATMVRKAHERAGLEAPTYPNTSLRYSVDRITGSPTLMNRADLLKSAQAMVKDALPALEAHGSASAEALKAEAAPLLACMADARCTDELLRDLIGAVCDTYGVEFVLGGTRHTNTLVPSPMPGATDTVRCTTAATLKHLDRISGQALLNTVTTYDLGANEPVGTKATKAPRRDAGRTTSYTMDIRTAWPIRVVTEEQAMIDGPDQRLNMRNSTTLIFTE